MSQELIYTSAPRGLKPGSRGFCTVVSTQGMSAALVQRLESLSGYRHVYTPPDPNARLNPVVFSHLFVSVGGRRYHVLSRICDAGLDYTQRTNKFAHHVVLDAAERVPAGPGWLLGLDGLLQATWDGEPKVLPAGRRPPPGTCPPAVCHAWQRLTGDAGWGGVLAETAANGGGTPAVLIFRPGIDPLPLLAESLALLPPEVRWNVSFTSYFTALPAGMDCQWRCVLAGSPEAIAARRIPRAVVIDLCIRLPPAAGGLYVEAARTGIAPAAARPPALPPGSLPSGVELARPLGGIAAPPVSRQAGSAETYGLTPLPQPSALADVAAPPVLRRFKRKRKPKWPLAVGVTAAVVVALAMSLLLLVPHYRGPDRQLAGSDDSTNTGRKDQQPEKTAKKQPVSVGPASKKESEKEPKKQQAPAEKGEKPAQENPATPSPMSPKVELKTPAKEVAVASRPAANGSPDPSEAKPQELTPPPPQPEPPPVDRSAEAAKNLIGRLPPSIDLPEVNSAGFNSSMSDTKPLRIADGDWASQARLISLALAVKRQDSGWTAPFKVEEDKSDRGDPSWGCYPAQSGSLASSSGGGGKFAHFYLKNDGLWFCWLPQGKPEDMDVEQLRNYPLRITIGKEEERTVVLRKATLVKGVTFGFLANTNRPETYVNCPQLTGFPKSAGYEVEAAIEPESIQGESNLAPSAGDRQGKNWVLRIGGSQPLCFRVLLTESTQRTSLSVTLKYEGVKLDEQVWNKTNDGNKLLKRAGQKEGRTDIRQSEIGAYLREVQSKLSQAEGAQSKIEKMHDNTEREAHAGELNEAKASIREYRPVVKALTDLHRVFEDIQSKGTICFRIYASMGGQRVELYTNKIE